MRKALLLLAMVVAVAVANNEFYHHHHNRHKLQYRHKNRAYARYPVRNERTAMQCNTNEHHLVCGPEKHCDRSCDNLFTPTNCVHVPHPKCYFPRCVCNDGYVRDKDGNCIRPSHCPNTYYEPASILHDVPNDMMIEFKPMKFSRIHKHKMIRRVRRPLTFDNKRV